MLDVTDGLPVITTKIVSLLVSSVVFRMSIPETGVRYRSQSTMSNRRRLTSSMASSARPVTVTL